MKRILTALVLIPVATWVLVFAPTGVAIAGIAIAACLSFHEYAAMVAAHGVDRPGCTAIAAGLMLLLLPRLGIAAAAGVAIAAMLPSLWATDLKRELARAGAFALGVVYIFGCWRTAIDLRAISPYWLFIAMALNWVGDTAAMYTGKAIGRHKLAPVISPGKTWEGAIASVAGSVVFTVAAAHYLIPGAPLWLAAAVGVLANIAGQIGDLCESVFKRGAGIKDSGTLLPGHGGVLDRVDSTLFAVPVAYAIVAAAHQVHALSVR